MSAGRFLVVGVGPGDPELMTLRAARAVAEADVVAYPETHAGSLAARIAMGHMGDGERLAFTVPMTGDGAAEAAYDAAADAIGRALDAGRTVALLCEGDPMLYGSAASLLARLAPRHTPQLIPGVIAATAAAAAAGVSLARGSDPLTILPATAPRATIENALAGSGGLVIYKVGRHFDALAGLVRAAGRSATLVVRASQPEEAVSPLAETPPGDKPYFSAIIVHPGVGPSAPAFRSAPEAGEPIAILLLGDGAAATARKARDALRAAGRQAVIHGLSRRVDERAVDVPFFDARHHVAGLFARGSAVVGVCAAGILIRAVAPLLSDKAGEPPVLALAEDGSAVVPLLGAHRGGAALARLLGETFGVDPAFTTRSEAAVGLALDDPPPGWRVADPAPFKRLAAALPAGGPGRADASLSFLPRREDGWPMDVRATIAPPEAGVPTYIARRVAVGMGAERGADPAAAVAFARAALEASGIDPRAVALVATLDRKADEPAIQAVADALGAPLRVFDAASLAAEEARLETPSETVRAAVGVAGVAEAAALAAAGRAGRLVRSKAVAGRLTLAIAAAPRPIEPGTGRARGHLAIVGTGPRAAQWRPAEAAALLSRADAFVGLTLYLDLVEDLRAGRPRHAFALGEETARTRFALELAGKGRTVALLSSGDPGIYAMASLAAELLDTGELSDAARRVALTVAPGISAAQALAARAGAPLGHDFAFVSLSDLLTPWPVIRRRIEAAAAGDFALALYNPRSRRRVDQLGEAMAILAGARAGETPVVVGSRLGRPGERIDHTTVAAFDPSRVDMLATVIVGASTTRRFTRGDGRAIVYTPRGYEVAP